jgi:hypothetical protein
MPPMVARPAHRKAIIPPSHEAHHSITSLDKGESRRGMSRLGRQT